MTTVYFNSCNFLNAHFFCTFVGAIGGEEGEKKEGEEGEGGIDPEIEAARREAEEKRQEKHRQMEAEREDMRQTIRDKVSEQPTLMCPKIVKVKQHEKNIHRYKKTL